MTTLRRLPLAMILVGALAGPSSAGDPGAEVATQRLLQEGFNHGDPARMLKARGRLLGLLAAEPGSAPLHYWVAVADWRLVPMLAAKDRQGAKRYCDDGLEHCDAALGADPKFAAALAMKAGLQGLSIQFNGAAAITLGPQMQANVARAITLAPNDPRIRLIDGINTLHTPGFFGGGADKALDKLKQAQALFVADSAADSTAPDWGRDDAFAWAGRAAMQLKDYAAARDFYLEALEINPSNGWVRTKLLPAAEEALAKEKAKS